MKRHVLIAALLTVSASVACEAKDMAAPRGAGGFLYGYATHLNAKSHSFTLVLRSSGSISGRSNWRGVSRAKPTLVQVTLAPGGTIHIPGGPFPCDHKGNGWGWLQPCQRVHVFTKAPWKAGIASATVIWQYSDSPGQIYQGLLEAGAHSEAKGFLQQLGTKKFATKLAGVVGMFGTLTDLGTFLNWVGSDPSAAALKGEALVAAAAAGDPEAVRFMLSKGADPAHKSAGLLYGNTARECAQRRNDGEYYPVVPGFSQAESARRRDEGRYAAVIALLDAAIAARTPQPAPPAP